MFFSIVKKLLVSRKGMIKVENIQRRENEWLKAIIFKYYT